MSETDPRSAEGAPPASTPSPAPDKREWAVRVVGEILEHMGVKPRLEVKDAADGGISIAVQLDAELPGVQPGKRSHVLDALQFLANKLVNRPGSERRWISIGVGGHPEPRARDPRRAAEPAPANAAASRTAPGKGSNGRPPPGASAKPVEEDEAALQPSEDGELTASARSMAAKSSSLGRFFGIVGMRREDRARVLRAVQGMGGVRISAEGLGRNRRVVFTPDNPSPAGKSSLPIPEEEE